MLDRDLIGQNLIKLRGNRSQAVVARDLKISVSALGMYERGKRIPRDEIKIALAKYYKTTVSDIFFSTKVHIL